MAIHSNIHAMRTQWKGKKLWHWRWAPAPRSEGVQYATGEKQRGITNTSRKSEAAGPKQKQHSIVDVFVKKIKDIKKTFHARMGNIKDKNGKDLV